MAGIVSGRLSQLWKQASLQLCSRAGWSRVNTAWTCTYCRLMWSQGRSLSQTSSSRGKAIDEETLSRLVPDFRYQDPRDRVSLSPTPKPARNKSLEQLPIIHVRSTYNNTMFTITDHTGRVLTWTSAGAEGFRNARKGTTFAAQSAGMSAARKAMALGLQTFRVKVKGIGPGRSSALKGLEMGGVSIATLQDVTPIPHNGCRPRKARRL